MKVMVTEGMVAEGIGVGGMGLVPIGRVDAWHDVTGLVASVSKG